MNSKRIRYCTRVLALDRPHQSTLITIWNKDNYSDFLKEEEKHYGLHLIPQGKNVSIVIEYTNIIWKYKIFYGSYKKRFKALELNDKRWENYI